jgi:nucleotide-binding universal stress UspA family protein
MGFRTVVCGTDLSEAGDEALRQADRESRLNRAQLAVVHVLSDTFPGAPGSAEVAERVILQREELANQVMETIEARLELLGRSEDVTIHVEDGPPAEGLARAVKELDGDLLVVGSHGSSGLRRLFLGNVATRVVREAHVPVLVARPTNETKRILLAVDFTPVSDKAARAAAEEARLRGAALTLFHSVEVLAPEAMLAEPAVIPPTPFGSYPVEEMNKAAEQRLRKLLAELDVPGDVVVADGPPGPAIVEHAERIGVELIVMGTASRTGIDRLLLGSVAARVVKDAHTSVLVVR